MSAPVATLPALPVVSLPVAALPVVSLPVAALPVATSAPAAPGQPDAAGVALLPSFASVMELTAGQDPTKATGGHDASAKPAPAADDPAATAQAATAAALLAAASLLTPALAQQPSLSAQPAATRAPGALARPLASAQPLVSAQPVAATQLAPSALPVAPTLTTPPPTLNAVEPAAPNPPAKTPTESGESTYAGQSILTPTFQSAAPTAPGTPPTPSTVSAVTTAAPVDIRPPGRPSRSVASGSSAPVQTTTASAAVLSTVAPTSTAPLATAAAVPPPAPAGATDPLPHTQVASALVPLQISGDGLHRLTVHLHPLDLGPVTVQARLDRGALSVELTTVSSAAHEALSSALPQLRQDLHDAGYSSVAVDVGTGSGRPDTGSGQREQSPVWLAAADQPVIALSPASSVAAGTRADAGLDRWL